MKITFESRRLRGPTDAVDAAGRRWGVWVRRRWGLRSGILETSFAGPEVTLAAIAGAVRPIAARELRPIAVLRSAAFGTILHLEKVPADLKDAAGHIDNWVRRGGAWVWNILVFDPEKVVLGVHTWRRLTESSGWYAEVLTQYRAAGYQCVSSDVQKGKFMQIMDKAQRMTPEGFLMHLIDKHVHLPDDEWH